MGEFKIDADAVRTLASLLEETGLGEIEYQDGDRRIRVAMPQAAAPAPVVAASQAPSAPATPTSGGDAKPAGAITSPMVGTVYLQAGPGEPPFVKVGDRVSAGDVIFIIEAMKVMNQMPAPKSGVVKSIEVENGQGVEFGETLMVIE